MPLPCRHSRRPAAAAAAAATAAIAAALTVPTTPAQAAPLSNYLLTAAAMPTTSPYDGPWKRTAGGTGLATPTAKCLEPKLSAAATGFRGFTGGKGARAVEHVARTPNAAASEKLVRVLVRRLVGAKADHGDCYAAWSKGVNVRFHNVVDIQDELVVVIATGKLPGKSRPLTKAWAIGRDGRRVAVLELEHRRSSTHDATLKAVLPVAKSAVGKLAG